MGIIAADFRSLGYGWDLPLWSNVGVWETVVGLTICPLGWKSAAQAKTGYAGVFAYVSVPKNAVITTAKVSVRAESNLAGAVCNLRLTGLKVINSGGAGYWGLAGYQTNRGVIVGGADDTKITTAQVDWDAVPAFTAGTWYDSPEIKTIIQEIVNQAGWAKGQTLGLFIDDHDDRSDHTPSFREINGTYPTVALGPILHIEYAEVAEKQLTRLYDDSRTSGASAGTGAQQTIAHGLSFTPTEQQIALTAGSATANPYHSAAPDATNIYVTATLGQAWYWARVG